MIEAYGLTKRYGSTAAVRDVSFRVDDGAVVGLLGANGAGKTTLLKMLTGFHFPSSGDALLNGHSVTEDPIAVKRCIGYVPENAPLYGDSLVGEFMDFIADARGLSGKKGRERVAKALSDCGLSSVRFKRIDELSKGYRQRLALAQAIVHDPPILILDEPTGGLDPNQILEIRALIREAGKSKTVILSTHILQEAEAVCSRVLILNEGRIAADGSPDQIASSMIGGDVYEVQVKGLSLDEALLRFKAIPGFISADSLEVLPSGVLSALVKLSRAGLHSDDQTERVFDWALASGFKLVGLTLKKTSLEEVFVRVTSKESDHA